MLKRLIPLFLIFLLGLRAGYAQQVSGQVVEKVGGQGIPFATLISHTASGVTAIDGSFTLSGLRLGDTLFVTCIGYKRLAVAVDVKTQRQFLLVRLDPVSVMLKQVSVKASRNYQADSLRNRKDFAKVFDYKGIGLKDIFYDRHTTIYTPDNYITSTHNTTQLVGIDVLSLAHLLSKNKSTESKLQKAAIQDENAAYVDHLFSKDKVIAVTAMKGDSLQNFMDTYRPTLTQARKMNSYDVVIYIKKCYDDFLKSYRPGASLFKM